MPLLSEDKINHIAHLALKGLEDADGLRVLVPQKNLLRAIKQILHAEVEFEEAIHARVRNKLASYSRPILEGSPEWEVLYEKTYREEVQKKGY